MFIIMIIVIFNCVLTYCFITSGKDYFFSVENLILRIIDLTFNKVEKKILLSESNFSNYSLDTYEIKYLKIKTSDYMFNW